MAENTYEHLRLTEDELKESTRKIKIIEYNETRYIEKFHSLTVQERADIIRKIINKYHSDEYLDRAYDQGRFPSNDLYYKLLSYAEKYGKECNLKASYDFMYIIDDKFVIRLKYGQGTSIDCFELENEDQYNKYMDNITDKVLLTNDFKHIDDGTNIFNEYTITVDDLWYISVIETSNYVNRKWSARIDNCDRNTVAFVDIQTIKHFNKLMEIMEINFRIMRQ